MKRNNVKNLAFLSILLGISVAVGILESFISLPIPVPGVKIGLANFINLFVLYYGSEKFSVGQDFALGNVQPVKIFRSVLLARCGFRKKTP